MKRLFYAISLLFGLSVLFSSCEKSENENKKDVESPVVGCWTEEGLSSYGEVDEYFEFTNTGYLKDYYADGSASFIDGVLSYPGTWILDYVSEYWIEDRLLYVAESREVVAYEFEMIGKDKLCLSWVNNKGKRETGTLVRIKKFTK